MGKRKVSILEPAATAVAEVVSLSMMLFYSLKSFLTKE